MILNSNATEACIRVKHKPTHNAFSNLLITYVIYQEKNANYLLVLPSQNL